MSFIEKLGWRYATKKFNGEIVPDSIIQKIKDAIRFAPSSLGAQPFHVVVVKSQEMKDKLFEEGIKQQQVPTSSHVFIFCARTDFPERAEALMQLVSKEHGTPREELQGYFNMVDGAAKRFATIESLRDWTGKQAYIALGFGLAACAELSIDAGPMEGMDPNVVKQVLNLSDYMHPQVAMAVGYRDPNDHNQPEFRSKVRFPESDMFTEI